MVATLERPTVRDTRHVDLIESFSKYRQWSERSLWAILAHLGLPASYADFGCGAGWCVRAARMAGVKPSLGIELSDTAKIIRPDWARIVQHDLSTFLNLERQYELVTSIEVGEYIERVHAKTYVDNLVRHTGHWLVFTSAAPGQGGDGVVNCQPQEYWRDLISKSGLMYHPNMTDHLRETWKWCTGPMFWLPQNVQVFMRATAL